jgi:hypothetical protein
LAELAGGDGLLLGDAEDFFLQGGREFYGGVVEELDVEVRRGPGNAGEGDVDGIGGGAGHEAEGEQRIAGHRKEDFTTEGAENTEKKEEKSGKG